MNDVTTLNITCSYAFISVVSIKLVLFGLVYNSST